MRSVLLIVLSLLSFSRGPIKIMELPEGELAWTTERPKNAKICVPVEIPTQSDPLRFVFLEHLGRNQAEFKLDLIHDETGHASVSIGPGMDGH